MSALYVAAAVVVVAALLLTLLWVFQRQLIYFPGSARAGQARDVIPGGRDVTLRTSDCLQLGAWFFPAGPAGRGVTVLVANGNAGNRSLRAALAQALARAGLSVLLFDYRGFDGNRGTPTEEGLARDARAAHVFLVDEAGVRPDRLVYYGESLGAAVGLPTCCRAWRCRPPSCNRAVQSPRLRLGWRTSWRSRAPTTTTRPFSTASN